MLFLSHLVCCADAERKRKIRNMLQIPGLIFRNLIVGLGFISLLSFHIFPLVTIFKAKSKWKCTKDQTWIIHMVSMLSGDLSHSTLWILKSISQINIKNQDSRRCMMESQTLRYSRSLVRYRSSIQRFSAELLWKRPAVWKMIPDLLSSFGSQGVRFLSFTIVFMEPKVR